MNHGKYTQVLAFCKDMEAFLLERHPDGRNSLLTALQKALKDIEQDTEPRQIIMQLDDIIFEQLRNAAKEANDGEAFGDEQVCILAKLLAFSAIMEACHGPSNQQPQMRIPTKQPIPFKKKRQ